MKTKTKVSTLNATQKKKVSLFRGVKILGITAVTSTAFSSCGDMGQFSAADQQLLNNTAQTLERVNHINTHARNRSLGNPSSLTQSSTGASVLRH